MWLPTEDELRSRLSNGQRRCDLYGLRVPASHVTATSMLDKLAHRAQDTGELRCYLCGLPIEEGDLHLDHVLPLVAGGAHAIENLEPACRICNLIKGDAHLFDPPLDDFKPLLERLRTEPPEVVWRDNRVLARRVLVAPRAVPIDESIGDFRKRPLLVRVLVSQPDPYRAMTLGAIERSARTEGLLLRAGELGRTWLKLLGMSDVHGNRPISERDPHDRRLLPDPFVVATRVRDRPGQWGRRGFRLRFRVDTELVLDAVSEQVMPPIVDHDELPSLS